METSKRTATLTQRNSLNELLVDLHFDIKPDFWDNTRNMTEKQYKLCLALIFGKKYRKLEEVLKSFNIYKKYDNQ